MWSWSSGLVYRCRALDHSGRALSGPLNLALGQAGIALNFDGGGDDGGGDWTGHSLADHNWIPGQDRDQRPRSEIARITTRFGSGRNSHCPGGRQGMGRRRRRQGCNCRGSATLYLDLLVHLLLLCPAHLREEIKSNVVIIEIKSYAILLSRARVAVWRTIQGGGCCAVSLLWRGAPGRKAI